ncbi:MAG: tetratricopeptide repeat protein [Gammaproteobacteria bacterium]|nr:tetratricopeptide repeat protein [Rhodocyclaceae bacterium]MBU3908080.1 tetratricopeptide repeat protein [Gammaproteobacteria bacterium]MBU3989565.1 tetratricopeptide repeat protein [Gammaproteobacteria bacterium]MBU4005721.1 tetratricopeptide repeat protein [Gammaproteobacteria bacterium]MBU4021531.1 tetratricopeptide repeat protein [Gammaproteobacteria bacterium]
MNLWIGVGALVGVALAFLLVPLWRQKSALAGRQSEIRWPAVGLLGVLPALTVGLYLYLGAPGILKELALTQAQSNYDVDGMVRALEDKLKATPNDPEGWYALGRAYIAFSRYADAEEVLRKATTQAPKDARIIAQYAEAMALKQGSLDGRPLELIKAALEISYEEEKALELAGLAAFQKENWAEALHYWRRLLKLLPKATEHHEAITQAVKTAERKLDIRLGGTGMPLPPQPAEPKKAPH